MPVVLLLVVVVVVIAVLALARERVRAERRAKFLAEYPLLGSVLAMCDKDRYRAIRDAHGRAGQMYAIRAVMKDFPGITLFEAIEVVDKLD